MNVRTEIATEEPPVQRVGTWRAAATGWRIFLPVIVGDALAQALLIAADPVPEVTFAFCALVIGSLLALLVAVWFTVCTAAAAVEGRPREALRRTWQRPAVPVWALGIGLLAIGAALLENWLAPLVLVLGGLVLSAAAAGRANALSGFRVVVRAPVRAVLTILVAVLLIVLSWVVALVLGLFLTGVLAAAFTWLWFGLVATLLLCHWSALLVRVE